MDTVEKVRKLLESLKKNFECTICKCLQQLLSKNSKKRPATCPLCKANISKRGLNGNSRLGEIVSSVRDLCNAADDDCTKLGVTPLLTQTHRKPYERDRKSKSKKEKKRLTFLNITNEAEVLGNSTEVKAPINQTQKEDRKSETKDDLKVSPTLEKRILQRRSSVEATFRKEKESSSIENKKSVTRERKSTPSSKLTEQKRNEKSGINLSGVFKVNGGSSLADSPVQKKTKRRKKSSSIVSDDEIEQCKPDMTKQNVMVSSDEIISVSERIEQVRRHAVSSGRKSRNLRKARRNKRDSLNWTDNINADGKAEQPRDAQEHEQPENSEKGRENKERQFRVTSQSGVCSSSDVIQPSASTNNTATPELPETFIPICALRNKGNTATSKSESEVSARNIRVPEERLPFEKIDEPRNISLNDENVPRHSLISKSNSESGTRKSVSEAYISADLSEHKNQTSLTLTTEKQFLYNDKDITKHKNDPNSNDANSVLMNNKVKETLSCNITLVNNEISNQKSQKENNIKCLIDSEIDNEIQLGKNNGKTGKKEDKETVTFSSQESVKRINIELMLSKIDSPNKDRMLFGNLAFSKVELPHRREASTLLENRKKKLKLTLPNDAKNTNYSTKCVDVKTVKNDKGDIDETSCNELYDIHTSDNPDIKEFNLPQDDSTTQESNSSLNSKMNSYRRRRRKKKTVDTPTLRQKEHDETMDIDRLFRDNQSKEGCVVENENVSQSICKILETPMVRIDEGEAADDEQGKHSIQTRQVQRGTSCSVEPHGNSHQKSFQYSQELIPPTPPVQQPANKKSYVHSYKDSCRNRGSGNYQNVTLQDKTNCGTNSKGRRKVFNNRLEKEEATVRIARESTQKHSERNMQEDNMDPMFENYPFELKPGPPVNLVKKSKKQVEEDLKENINLSSTKTKDLENVSEANGVKKKVSSLSRKGNTNDIDTYDSAKPDNVGAFIVPDRELVNEVAAKQELEGNFCQLETSGNNSKIRNIEPDNQNSDDAGIDFDNERNVDYDDSIDEYRGFSESIIVSSKEFKSQRKMGMSSQEVMSSYNPEEQNDIEEIICVDVTERKEEKSVMCIKNPEAISRQTGSSISQHSKENDDNYYSEGKDSRNKESNSYCNDGEDSPVEKVELSGKKSIESPVSKKSPEELGKIFRKSLKTILKEETSDDENDIYDVHFDMIAKNNKKGKQLKRKFVVDAVDELVSSEENEKKQRLVHHNNCAFNNDFHDDIINEEMEEDIINDNMQHEMHNTDNKNGAYVAEKDNLNIDHTLQSNNNGNCDNKILKKNPQDSEELIEPCLTSGEEQSPCEVRKSISDTPINLKSKEETVKSVSIKKEKRRKEREKLAQQLQQFLSELSRNDDESTGSSSDDNSVEQASSTARKMLDSMKRKSATLATEPDVHTNNLKAYNRFHQNDELTADPDNESFIGNQSSSTRPAVKTPEVSSRDVKGLSPTTPSKIQPIPLSHSTVDQGVFKVPQTSREHLSSKSTKLETVMQIKTPVRGEKERFQDSCKKLVKEAVLMEQSKPKNIDINHQQSPHTTTSNTPISAKNVPVTVSFEEDTKVPIVMISRLTRQKSMYCVAALKKLQASFSQAPTEKVTHLVVSTDENQCLTKDSYTFKYLIALLRGIWIVDIKWLQECLKFQKFVNEESFQAKGDSTDGQEEVPKRYRNYVARNKEVNLFTGYRMFLHGQFQQTQIKKEQLSVLLKKAGCELAISIEDVYCSSSQIETKLVTDNLLELSSSEEELISNYGLQCIHPEWVVDSIINFKIQDTSRYVLRFTT